MPDSKPPQIFGLMVKIMQEVEAIGKNKKNTQQNYSFRGIDDVYLALNEPLSKNGVFYTTKVESLLREERTSKQGSQLVYTVLTVRYTFYAPDGSSVDCVIVGEGMDSGDKSVNKALSASLKYNLLQTFCIPTEEPKDSEHDSHDLAPRKTAMKSLADDLGTEGFKQLLESYQRNFAGITNFPAIFAALEGVSGAKCSQSTTPAEALKKILESQSVFFDPATKSIAGLKKSVFDTTNVFMETAAEAVKETGAVAA